MALHELFCWILRLELLSVGCVQTGSIGANVVKEQNLGARENSFFAT